MEQENTNSTQPQSGNNAGFDFKNLPKSAIVTAVICGIGIIGVFLPWVTADLGFLGSYSVSGVHSTWGWLSLLGFAGAAGSVLFGSQMNLPEALNKNLPLYCGGGALLFTGVALVQVFGGSGSYGYGGVHAGFGIYVTLLAAVALLLVGLKVIKL